jgi:hypothetical protein
MNAGQKLAFKAMNRLVKACRLSLRSNQLEVSGLEIWATDKLVDASQIFEGIEA